MKNNIFLKLLFLIFIITTSIILIPLVMLFINGLINIGLAIRNKEVIYAIRLSFLTATISTLITFSLALPTAYVLSRSKSKIIKKMSVLIMLPMSLPHIISGIALILFLGNPGIGKYLERIGIDFVFSKSGIVAAQVFINLPYTVEILKGSIDNLNPRLEFISRTLGCNKIQTFVYITLPLIKNGIISSLIITFSRSLGEFGAVVMLAGATSMKTEVLSTSIFMNMSTGDMDIALGTSIILIIISFLSMMLFEFIKKKEIEEN